MLTFKQRYKPRTEREYTKSDLTVYDSAGNTALRGLKVYGKSEVVDGAIKSAGEGYAVVDLGTLTWSYRSDIMCFYNDQNTIPNAKYGVDCICEKYVNTLQAPSEMNNMCIRLNPDKRVYIKDANYTDATAFKNSLNGVLLCYQLDDPTQGNTIAIKTDNGTGIDGTMATFATGTPLYGVSDTVRDVMQWDGSSGEVTKNCVKVRLADLTWDEGASHPGGFSTNVSNMLSGSYNLITTYPFNNQINFAWASFDGYSDNTMFRNRTNTYIYIKSTSYTGNLTDFVASLGDAELVYELATPTTEQLTQAENESIASLRTFDETTHFTNNASTAITANYTIKVPTIS